jgi:hypothetical protein
VDRWHHERDEQASGSGLDPMPVWPRVVLTSDGECKGCERMGTRSERYTVHFLDHEDASHDCAFDEARWRSYELDSAWAGEVGVMGGLECDDIAAPADGE